MTDNGRSINISGGTFQGSAVGIGRVTQQGTVVNRDADSLTELRALLAGRADEIVALGRNEDERADLRHEVRKIERELQADEPDGASVTTRWKSVLAVLDGVVAAGTKVAGITELVRQIFGG